MTFLLVLLSVVPPAWAALVLLWPPFSRVFGREALAPGMVCAVWCAASAAVAVFVPGAVFLTAAAGGALAVFMARGRMAAWTGPRPLPPGSMAFSLGVRSAADRGFYLENFARWGPVFKTTQFGAPVICVTGMERICRLMRGHAQYLGPSPLPFTRGVMGNFLRYMDDETHAKYGGLFRRAMSGVAAEGNHAWMAARGRELLLDFAEGGPCRPEAGLRRFTRRALEMLLFGFTGEGGAGREFADLAERFYPGDIRRALSRGDRGLMGEMARVLAAKAAVAASGTDASVIARLRASDPSMPDRVCLDNLILMHKVGTDNVSSLLLWLLYWWATRPEEVAEILSSKGHGREEALSAFLSETLRLSQSEYIYRKVSRTFDFEGFRFPAGWIVRSCIWESHRTTDALADPGKFQLRLGAGDYSRDHFNAFGMGRHACNAVEITHIICLALLDALAAGFDLHVAKAEPFQRFMRHWSHWLPNRAMTVTVRVADRFPR